MIPLRTTKMINMLPKSDILKVYDDVEHRYEDFFIHGKDSEYGLDYIFEHITFPCGIRTDELRLLSPLGKIEKTLDCCRKLNIDQKSTYYILKLWSANAPILVGIERPLDCYQKFDDEDIAF